MCWKFWRNRTDNDDYVNGEGFCCQSKVLRAGTIGNGNDNPELFPYYYHADHFVSSSLITNLDGETVRYEEYVPFGEVFIEERNNTWNTPYHTADMVKNGKTYKLETRGAFR